jgi:catechol 2,3-dioxygenase-like lactoylglutathione lyase family enzyme
MAMTAVGFPMIGRLTRFSLTTANARELAAFYGSAFGCRLFATERRSGADFENLLGVEGGAESVTLGLGDELIEIMEFDHPGRPYPIGALASDLIFQHIAIVVTNIDHAYQRLSAVAGWTAISTAGPQRLPDRSGGVTAFKFRDPNGHPLEILAFPQGKGPARWHAERGRALCVGIDHSAISVSDNSRSVTFYEHLGFEVAARSHNHGPEQERLDGILDPQVDVTALAPRQRTPHVELLCYGGATHDNRIVMRNNDIASTRLVFEACDSTPVGSDQIGQQMEDPDGHHLLILRPIEKLSEIEAHP